MSQVSIVKVENDYHDALLRALDDLGEKSVNRGDRVLIKPNLYEPHAPDSGDITNPRLVEAVAQYCLDAGASRVIIGEGPSYYQSETSLRPCFTQTGVSEVTDRLGIEWVLFDEHKYRTFRNISKATPDEFRVTEFAFTCDKLINVPVMKTHYQTTVTLAMKNLKGCLKREDKPRFHHKDLQRAIVELNKIVRPSLNIIDATARTIGSVGSSARRQPIGARLLLVSTDAVAVDAVGCALMGIDPDTVPTVTLGAAAGLGESDLARIEIIGEELKRLKFKVKLPQEQLRQSFPQLEISGTDRACSGCLIPLLSSLLMLSEQNAKLKTPLCICVGTEPDVPENGDYLLIGDCATSDREETANCIAGCPPERETIHQRLAPFFESG
ncbi:MAG TPA: DUF362 domain-containing protein [Dehalococcoidales bacterium]|nr:DUF362 domain-containing protein [Dehalococcoidales bacterium]